ncbi:MAG: TniQ family protein [Chloroflexi bacterium]|nr:TniQ family protein [Chloroflexota bacterium]
MDLRDLVVYEEWDVAPPAVPPRGRLFPLAPVGIGTPETECLTSYITRLAEAHGVLTRDLVVHELAGFLGRAHLAQSRNLGLLSAFWRNETRALNGTRTLAHNMVQGLEALTGRQGLRFLTLLTWTEVLPVQQLQRRSRAWCPHCYEEWRQAKQTVYEPLLWSLAPVTICPRHRRLLQGICPYPDCRQRSHWLSARSRCGYCARCGRFLGSSVAPAADEGDSLTEQEAMARIWVAHAVGELIAAAPGLGFVPRREQIVDAITASAERLTGGNISAWARKLGMAVLTVSNWRWKEARPSLWLLLQVCARLGTTPLGFLTGEASQVSGQAVLRHELAHRPPRVHTVVDPKVARRALEQILAGDEMPPPSLREVGQRLGLTYATLRHHLPELCRAISERYRNYQLAQAAETRRRLCQEVREATLRVHEQGVFPSSYRIEALIGRPHALRHRPAREAWRKALRELGWQT